MSNVSLLLDNVRKELTFDEQRFLA